METHFKFSLRAVGERNPKRLAVDCGNGLKCFTDFVVYSKKLVLLLPNPGSDL